MKRFRVFSLILIASCLAIPASFSQDISTQGTEFWVSFMGNGLKDHPFYGTWLRIQLVISAKDACDCTITNPQTGWTDSFRINANSTYFVEDIDWEQAYMELYEYESVKNKGLLITTTDTVSVYCANIAAKSFDASYVMPIEGLADDYIIQTYDQSSNDDTYTSAFLIVATEDNTVVDITPSVTTMGNRPAGEEFSVTLNRGQTYQVRSSYSYWGSGFDLSGSRVTARDCKKIAVFNGNNLTLIPTDAYGDADCVFEQAMPVQSWGKQFIVTASLDRDHDFVKITSATNGNVITKNGEPLCTLYAGQSNVFTITNEEKSCYLEATQSCAVFLYNNSSDRAGNGAPSMVWIAPIEQRIDEITFSTFNYEHTNVNIYNHYVNVIVNANDIQDVYFDNEFVPPTQFDTVNGNPEYMLFRARISHGVHHLHCANGFIAHVYGFGDSRGYAYMVGSKTTNLFTTILVNDEIIQQHDTIGNCTLDPVTFGAEISYHDYEIEWDFGDGTTSHESPVTHTYADHELYEVTLTVTSEETPCQSSPSTTHTFYIDARTNQDVHYFDEACIGQVYSGYGFEGILIDSDTTLVREVIIPTHPECDHFVFLNILAYHIDDTTTVRLCYDNSHPASYTWVDGINYTEDTLITKSLSYGDCEGTCTLDLEFFNTEPIDIDTVGCDSFDWEIDGQVYHLDSTGVYSHLEYIPGFDCQRETRLHLTLSPTPNPVIESSDSLVELPHYPITATEFNVNRYTYCINDKISDISTWDLSQCEWSITKGSWRIVPSDDNLCCTVYAMDWVPDTVWLCFKAVNPCKDTLVKYWLMPSFYGIEENHSNAGFTIVPNPNNGEMELHFENLTGNVGLKVYDMRGLLIDQFDLYLSTKAENFRYDLKGLSTGIYFIVATAREGTIARKVVIGNFM